MRRGTLYVFFLFAGLKTGKVKIVVGETPFVGVEAGADEDVRPPSSDRPEDCSPRRADKGFSNKKHSSGGGGASRPSTG